MGHLAESQTAHRAGLVEADPDDNQLAGETRRGATPGSASRRVVLGEVVMPPHIRLAAGEIEAAVALGAGVDTRPLPRRAATAGPTVPEWLTLF